MRRLLLRVGLIFAFFMLVIVWIGHRSYEMGFNKAQAMAEAEYQAAKDDHQSVVNEASQNYQLQKDTAEKEKEIRYVEVQKIIDKPIYLNVCLDASGVQVLNEAIRAR